jgi:hypothetical protein
MVWCVTITRLDNSGAGICLAFDTAFDRMVSATSRDEQLIEISNALHHMYRLGELRRREWGARSQGSPGFTGRVRQVPGALGSLWIRNYEVHQSAQVAELDGGAVMVWRAVSSMQFIVRPQDADRYADYTCHLEERPVLDTLRIAFDGLTALP